jgi:hypothetical protein
MRSITYHQREIDSIQFNQSINYDRSSSISIIDVRRSTYEWAMHRDTSDHAATAASDRRAAKSTPFDSSTTNDDRTTID